MRKVPPPRETPPEPPAQTGEFDIPAWERHGHDQGWLPESRFVIGLDVGQQADATVASIIERRATLVEPLTFRPDKRTLEWVTTFDVRELIRLPLHMPYPSQVEAVAAMLRRLPRGSALAVDATGCGRPVFDMFKSCGSRVAGVVITSGSEATQPHDDLHRVPKSILVSRLQSLVHLGRLRVAADLPSGQILLDEMAAFSVGFTATGAMTWNARTGHDDAVLSVAIGCWYAHEHLRPTKKLTSWW